MKNLDALIDAEARAAAKHDLEWKGQIGGEDVTLYSSRMTPADTDFVNKRHPNWMSSPSNGAMVEMLIRKVKDENGVAVFKPAHRAIMMRWGAGKINDIFAGLYGEDLEEVNLDDEGFGDRVKN